MCESQSIVFATKQGKDKSERKIFPSYKPLGVHEKTDAFFSISIVTLLSSSHSLTFSLSSSLSCLFSIFVFPLTNRLIPSFSLVYTFSTLFSFARVFILFLFFVRSTFSLTPLHARYTCVTHDRLYSLHPPPL